MEREDGKTIEELKTDLKLERITVEEYLEACGIVGDEVKSEYYKGEIYLIGRNEAFPWELKDLGHCQRMLNLRRYILDRDSNICVRCGKTDKREMHVHHILPKSEFPEKAFVKSNLVTLCPECHRYVHRSDYYRNEERETARKAKEVGRSKKTLGKILEGVM